VFEQWNLLFLRLTLAELYRYARKNDLDGNSRQQPCRDSEGEPCPRWRGWPPRRSVSDTLTWPCTLLRWNRPDTDFVAIALH
ncbi:MAG: hypothetical protein ACJ769_10560, partial [Chloroflexota bacterium]